MIKVKKFIIIVVNIVLEVMLIQINIIIQNLIPPLYIVTAMNNGVGIMAQKENTALNHQPHLEINHIKIEILKC